MKSSRKPVNILIHTIVWLAYIFILVEVFSNRDTVEVAIQRVLILVIPQILLVYLNVFYYIPKFFNQKKYWEYGGIVLLSFILLYFYYRHFPDFTNQMIMRDEFGPRGRPPFGWRGGMMNPMRMRAIFNLTSAISIFLISTIIEVTRLATVKDKEAAKLRSENLNTELKFLKSQINPHFLFNALNNIYAMSMMQSKDAPKMILKLSDILRYNLYDGVQDRVPIEKEIRYIENYVSFQKLKDENIRNINVDFDGVDSNVMIAPLILIPFVENSFKHSKIEDVSKGWINIDLKTEDDKIIFKVSNSVPETEFKKDASGGIGLDNVKRRLELIYPKSYDLNIEESVNQFSVTLTIFL